LLQITARCFISLRVRDSALGLVRGSNAPSLLRRQQLASGLAARFGLLIGGSRTAVPRHQRLHALIDWSYELLSVTEQQMLRRFSVFAGATAKAASRSPRPNCSPPTASAMSNYLQHNPDVAAVHVDPFRHFETIGWK
jgi:hypothetical protein